jgi:hypothetical protein
LTKSFASAADTAQRYPPSVQADIIAGAKTAFLNGDQWAYLAGIIAVLLGGVLVYFCFPKLEREQQLLAEYHDEDVASSPREPVAPAAPRLA